MAPRRERRAPVLDGRTAQMRDQWDLDGGQIARACGWAIRVLLVDLRKRGGGRWTKGRHSCIYLAPRS